MLGGNLVVSMAVGGEHLHKDTQPKRCGCTPPAKGVPPPSARRVWPGAGGAAAHRRQGLLVEAEVVRAG